jgi:Rab11 family-interacting protein 3/4
MILEEQVREEQSRAEQRLQEEQRRQKDLVTRLEREKQLELENSAIRYYFSIPQKNWVSYYGVFLRLQAAERRSQGLEEEVKRIRGQVERQAEGRRIAEETAAEAEAAGVALRAQLAEVTEAARKRQEALEQELADTSQVSGKILIESCEFFSFKINLMLLGQKLFLITGEQYFYLLFSYLTSIYSGKNVS